MDKDYELSNISYTNKDFFDIYPELLQLAKRLSSRWDPTVSNESDPGVVLIKELALIADKINYISDKYALENNPRSVTQIENARQLYNLLGYYPEWYQSAKVNISMYWDGDKEEFKKVIIPRFTQVKDSDGDFVYTLLSDVSLPLDGTYASGEIEAIEGTYNRLVVNNSDVITLSMISDDHRIFISDYNVAQNGIFVTDSTGAVPWEQVRNINIVESMTRCYSFNVDIVTGQCYLQFPRDIASLIGDGLIVHYIISRGKEGNIPINYLTKLTTTTLNTVDLDGNEVSVDCENIMVTNTGNTFRGKDPVGIDEMYENWKHIAGTFDTLVTLRDYNNAVRRYPDLASNGFVTDRTNDVQLSYKVMQGTAEMPTTKTKIEKYPTDELYDAERDYNGDGRVDEDDRLWFTGKFVDSMYSNKITPYDLKLYCLRAFPYDSIDTYTDYNSTFELYSDMEYDITDSEIKRMVDALNTFKCISHEFYPPEQGKICFLKNKYNINLQILPNQELTSPQALEVKRNICKAVYNKFNSSKIEFGEEISYDDLLECIKNSDSRIKTAILDRLTYDTYAVFYLDNGGIEWFEVPVSDDAYQEFVDNEDSLFKVEYEDGYAEYKEMWKYEWKREAAKKYAKQFRTEIVAKNILAGITPYIVDIGGGYPYSFNNKVVVDTAADSVKTNVLIKMKFDKNHKKQSVTLRENEVIQFSRPNLLDIRTYGAYVYYEYIGRRVEADTDYMLGSDESIVFFYKEADKDSKYHFDIYGPGTIIHPAFQLVQNEKDITSFVFGQNRPTEPGECLIGYRALASVKQYTGLSVNQSVVIKKINQVQLPKKDSSEAYIYFVTKIKENEEYKLDLTSGRKVLDEGEFFIYTNGSKTSLDILGSGTEIIWVGDAQPRVLSCDYTDVSNIALYGAVAIKGKWLTINEHSSLFIREKSFINALEGDTVTFTLGGEFDEVEFTLDSEGIVPDDDLFTYDLSMYKPTPDKTEEQPVAATLIAVPRAEGTGDGPNTPSENLLEFVSYIYDDNVVNSSHDDVARLECVQIRGLNEEEDDNVEWRNLYAWRCIAKDNAPRWIYDRHTYLQLFCVGEEFSEEKYERYKELLGITEEGGDNTAGVGRLTTITDMSSSSNSSNAIAGDGNNEHPTDTPNVNDEEQYEYVYSELEREAFESWDAIRRQHNAYDTYTYLQSYVDYGNLSEDEIVDDLIYINYTYTLASDEAPLSRFSKIDINGEEIDISPSFDIATEAHAYLNIDMGPDRAQVLRADSTSKYPYVIDQMTFYIRNVVQDSVNVEEPYKETTVYANVNVYGQGSKDPIDVTYYDEHLQKKNPVFYAHEKIKANKDSSGQVTLFTEQGKNHFIAFGKEPSGEDVRIFSKAVCLPKGNYILSVGHSNYCLSLLELKYGSRKLKILGTDNETNIAEPKTYYMTFSSSGSNVHFTVTYSLKDTEPKTRAFIEGLTNYKYNDEYLLAEDIEPMTDYLKDGAKAGEYLVCTRDCTGTFSWADWAATPFPLYDLAISPLIKYKKASGYNKDYYNIDSDELYQKMVDLDYDEEFNYLYKIPETKLIKNPLKDTSFNNVNHVYNPFTICEAELPSVLV